MGSLGAVFNGISKVASGITGKGRTGYFKATQKWNRSHQKRGGYAGGWGAIAFGNIINAHSSAEEIVDTFGLDNEENSYGCDAYAQSYKEQYDIAEMIYEEWVNYYVGIIENLVSQMNSCIERKEELTEQADNLKSEAEDLESEAESLIDEAETSEDIEEIYDLIEQAQELRAEAKELKEQAEELLAEADNYRLEALELQGEIEDNTMLMQALNIEQFIDDDAVKSNAFDYACVFAQDWINGAVWIPPDVLSWAYYEVSDHNG